MNNRQLVYCVVSNKDTIHNFEKSVLMKKDTAYWGFNSSGRKLQRMFDKIKMGDVLVFSKNKKVDYIGVVTKLYYDPNKGVELGWRHEPNKVYDLIVEFKKLKVDINNIRDFIGWQNGIPNGSTIIMANCDKFWNEYQDKIDTLDIDPEEYIEEADEEPGFVYIYGYVNKPNGPVYIGQSDNPKKRLDGHDNSTCEELIVYLIEASPTGDGRELEGRIHTDLKDHRNNKKSWTGDNKDSGSWYDVLPQKAVLTAQENIAALKLIQKCS